MDLLSSLMASSSDSLGIELLLLLLEASSTLLLLLIIFNILVF